MELETNKECHHSSIAAWEIDRSVLKDIAGNPILKESAESQSEKFYSFNSGGRVNGFKKLGRKVAKNQLLGAIITCRNI